MRQLTWVAGAAVVVMLTGCGGETEDEASPDSPLSEKQASKRVEKHISDTVSVLPDSLKLEPVGSTVSAPCEPDHLITVSKSYWLDGLPAEENKQYVDEMVKYWTTNGYTVVDDLRPDELFVSVGNDKDGFGMSVRTSVQGNLSLGASSPCINPGGTDE